MKRKSGITLWIAASAIAFLVFASIPCIARAAPGSTGTTGIFNWTELADGTLRIDSPTDWLTGDLPIPGTLDGKTVTEIGQYAFCAREITSVTIPGSVTAIDTYAFSYCNSLTSVTFEAGSQLATIGDYAFSGTALESVSFPSSVTTIHDCAFSGCGSLASVTFDAGSRLTTIGQQAFSSSAFTSITIPGGMTDITNYAFAGCPSLSSVHFEAGSHLATIGTGAFFNDAALTDITLPSSLETIGENAFYGATALTDITIPSSVTSIVSCAFYHSGISRCIIYSKTAVFGSTVFYDTNISSDGIYGYEGSTAQAYAGSNGIPFIPFLALTPSPSSLQIYTGGSITIAPNVEGGDWTFDATLLSRSGNVFTGLKPGTAHVTYTAGWQSESVDIAISQALQLSSSPSDNHIYTGGRITITPNLENGEWTFDSELLSRNGNEFTGLQPGTAHVAYTVGEQSETVDVVISDALTLSVSPANGQIYTGGRITITPNLEAGEWTFDTTLLSRNGNEFTGLKSGTAHVTYTVGAQSESVDVVIREAELPSTGQDFSPTLLLLAAAALAGGAALASLMRKRRRQRAG